MSDVAAVEETVKRLSSHKGVVGIVIVNGDGVPIRTTLDQELAVQYAALVSQLTLKARHMVRELAEDGTDDLQFLRVRSKRHEIMIAPGFDKVRCARGGGWGGWQPVAVAAMQEWLAAPLLSTQALAHGEGGAPPAPAPARHAAVGAAGATVQLKLAKHPPFSASQDHNYTLLVVQTPQAD